MDGRMECHTALLQGEPSRRRFVCVCVCVCVAPDVWLCWKRVHTGIVCIERRALERALQRGSKVAQAENAGSWGYTVPAPHSVGLLWLCCRLHHRSPVALGSGGQNQRGMHVGTPRCVARVVVSCSVMRTRAPLPPPRIVSPDVGCSLFLCFFVSFPPWLRMTEHCGIPPCADADRAKLHSSRKDTVAPGGMHRTTHSKQRRCCRGGGGVCV